MALEKQNALQTVPLYRVETPIQVTQNGVVAVDDHTITVDETLVAHELEGQVALITLDATVVGAGVDGYFLNVLDNTGGAGADIMFEEDVSTILADDDELAISKHGQPKADAGAGVVDYFGVFRSNALPIINRSLFQGYYHGSDNMPGLHELIHILNEYGDTMEMWLKNAAVLAIAMGECEETTADFDAADPAQTLEAHSHYPGSGKLTLAEQAEDVIAADANAAQADIDMGVAIANYADDDVIRIHDDVTPAGEILHVLSIAGNTITCTGNLVNAYAVLQNAGVEVLCSGEYVDGAILYVEPGATGKGEVVKISALPVCSDIILTNPLKNFHDAAAIVHLINQAVTGVPDTVITKDITLSKYNPPTFTLEFSARRTKRWAANDFVLQIMGLIVESLEFTSAPGDEPLKISIGVKGLASRHQTIAGADVIAGGSKVELGFDKGSYIPTTAYASVDGIKYRTAEAASISVNRNIDTVPVHNQGDKPYYKNGDPWEHWAGVVDTKFNVMIPLQNKNLYNHVINGDSVDCVIVYTRPGVDDELSVTAKSVTFNTNGLEIPEEGKYPQNMEGQALYCTIQVKDFIPYYVL